MARGTFQGPSKWIVQDSKKLLEKYKILASLSLCYFVPCQFIQQRIILTTHTWFIYNHVNNKDNNNSMNEKE